jgi:NAD(P)-dependent dehydrogenase (short-subunit alcohol dehydrogenase family)
MSETYLLIKTGGKWMSKWFSMAGRRALVTGGSLSIGRSLALGFADQGADVAIHYSAAADAAFGKPDAAQETLAAVTTRGVRGCLVESDLARPGAGGQTVTDAATKLGGVDILVICASVQSRMSFFDVTRDDMQRQFDINFRATVELLQAALPPMKAQGWGRILTIGSINQVRPEPELAIYAALKSAQHNLCINLARQYAPFNVMINNLSPGMVATERNRWRRQDADAWRDIQAKVTAPIGRAGEPDEMVGAALLLCSDAASYIAGTDVMITGGSHLPGLL